MILRRLLLPLTGFVILAVILLQTDLQQLWVELVGVGLGGFAAVVVIHAWSFFFDVLLWQLAFSSPRATFSNWGEFYLIRLVGEAYNNALPLASVGGEPIKARLLRQRLDIGYTESGVAFLVAKTANLIALVLFLAIGFVFLMADPRFSGPWRSLAGVGLAAFSLAIVVLWGAQQFRSARLVRHFVAHREAHPRRAAILAALTRFDDQLARCYRAAPRRFLICVGLAFLTWVAGILEIWIILAAIDTPISLDEAWVVEATVQLVRTAAFFIPSGLGVVEGGFVLVVGTITGSSTLGVAVAVVRRARDLLWIIAGFVGALRYVGRGGLRRLARSA